MDLDLERGRRVYYWWGRHTRLFRVTSDVVCLRRRQERHQRAVDALGLSGGRAVLDLACGHGVNFPLLEEKIGRSESLVALDYSEETVISAQERARSEGRWS